MSVFGYYRPLFKVDMDKTYWEHYSHPSDMGIRGIGRSKADAFEQAALAMTAVITDIDKIEPREQVELVCENHGDDELLLTDWLNAVLYEMATRNMLFSRFQVTFEADKLRARLWGEKIDRDKHNPAVEVKAATYSDLKVERKPDGTWIAQCIVDV